MEKIKALSSTYFVTSSAQTINDFMSIVTQSVKKDINALASLPTGQALSQGNDIEAGCAVALVKGHSYKLGEDIHSLFIGTKNDFNHFFQSTTDTVQTHVTDMTEFTEMAIEHLSDSSHGKEAEILDLDTVKVKKEPKDKVGSVPKMFAKAAGVDVSDVLRPASAAALSDGDIVFLSYQDKYCSFGIVQNGMYYMYGGDPLINKVPLNVLGLLSIERVVDSRLSDDLANIPLKTDCCQMHKTMDGNECLFEFMLTEIIDANADNDDGATGALLDAFADGTFNGIIENHKQLKEAANASKH